MADNFNGALHGNADFAAPVSDAVYSASSDFSSEDDNALARRFGKPKKKHGDLIFEFTRDPAFLHQYFRIYKSECRMVEGFSAAEEEYNRKSHIIVVRQGNLCVGGARLFVKTPRQKNKRFLLELAGFKLEDHFPQLEMKQLRYAELSRLVLLPDFRNGSVTRHMFHNLYRKAVALDLDLIFAAAPLANVRSYRSEALAYGIKEAKIHFDIDIPPDPGFEEIKDYLLSISIDSVSIKSDKEYFADDNIRSMAVV